ncbi:MAG: Pyruvate kinase [Chlamydiae bacterium]|nr:Pyruvate kinase [Chlamydiota bacterium]
MNIARLNFSHGTHEGHLKVIEYLKKAREELNQPLAIMLDNKGPEVRIGNLPAPIHMKKGETYFLTEHFEDHPRAIPINPFSVLLKLDIGVKVLFDDGYITSHVVEVEEKGVWVEIENEGKVSSHKGVNVPGVALDLPILTPADLEDIRFGCSQDIDILAVSFIRSSEHVFKIKRLLKEFGKPEVLVVAKIENYQGINNFDSILKVADGIMVARGDLGVEVPISQVPRLQKQMIRKCFEAGKPAITATQMLESMIHNPRPTRAEVSDVANAIYDSTSCVMLSGESAMGGYPTESVQVLSDIIADTEAYFNYKDFFYSQMQSTYKNVPSAVTSATVSTAYTTEAKAIFVYTSTGYTSRLISKWRCAVPILVLTDRKKVYHQLALNWGLIPIYYPKFKTMADAFSIICDYAISKKIVSLGDIVVVTAGSPFGVTGSTNMMLVESIGDVLIRAKSGYGEVVAEQVTHLHPVDEGRICPVKNKILVMSHCDDSHLAFLKEASGIILENHADDLDSEKYAILVGKTMNIPVVVRAEGASTVLKEGQLVTLDPKAFLVYNGSIALKP